ncbi:MAG: ADOP family duplicated permease [Gemmatimonadaceae bacterium]
MTLLADLATDLRYALRAMRRAPAYAVAATLTLAVGIGAMTGVASVVDAVLFRALPYRDANSLAAIIERTDKGSQRTPSYPAYKDYLAAVGGPVAGLSYGHGTAVPFQTRDGLVRVVAYWVTPGFFPLMGTAAETGRTFSAADEAAGAPAVAVVSHGFWRRYLGGDPGAVGRTVDVDSVATTIVGVMPAEFDYPDGTQLWIPISQVETHWEPLLSREVHADSRTIVRLRSPRDSAAAAAGLGVVAARLAAEYPESSAHWTGVEFWPMWNQVVGNISSTLYALGGAAALVLLLACANVATLALIRGSVRGREIAVRAALGASRARIARVLCAEVAVIAIAGGVLGTALAAGIVRAVRQGMGPRLPRSAQLAVDARMFAIGIAIALIAMLLVSIAPALRSSRFSLAGRLQGNRDSGAGLRDSKLRAGLVAAQVALAVTLLVGAGLLLQSFHRLYVTPDDYDTQHIASAPIFPPSPTYDRPADAAALYARLRDAVAKIPGVDGVAIVNHIGGRLPTRVDIPGRPVDSSPKSTAYYVTASSEYASVMRFRIMRGRWFTDADMRAPDASGFVINETMAKHFFPDADPVGHVITVHRTSQGRADIGQPISGPIIGVMADVHWYGAENRVEDEVYVPYTREVWPWVNIVAHAKNPAAIAPAMHKAILSVEPRIPLGTQYSGDGIEIPRARTFDQRELTLSIVGAFAGAALLLAAIGLYGVVAYGVTQRTRELGIRTALGATRHDVAKLVLVGVGKLVVVGLVAGLAGGFAATRLIRAMLFQTAPGDPATLAIVSVTMTLVAFAAAWGPARKAMSVEPTEALRAE